jgi:hypothetical protein
MISPRGLKPVQQGLSDLRVPVPPTPRSQYDPPNDELRKASLASVSVPTYGAPLYDLSPTFSESYGQPPEVLEHAWVPIGDEP